MVSIRAQGFAEPTPIQCQAWPMALSGRDVMAIAQTGSGNTIAFALPAMLHINAPYQRVSVLQPDAALGLTFLSSTQTTFTVRWRWPHLPPRGPNCIDAAAPGFTYDSLAGLDFPQYPDICPQEPRLHRHALHPLYVICSTSMLLVRLSL